VTAEGTMHVKTEKYRVQPGKKLSLKTFDTRDDGGWEKADAQRELEQLSERMDELQELLYAEGKHSLLIVLQAMDGAGKDSTVHEVFGAFNPAGCTVYSFKVPSEEERGHDFLWRVHSKAPRAGYVSIFNRSHYEDVLVVRVKQLVPEHRWKARYDHINAFERMLYDEGTTIVKLFLHISKDYQKERMLRRLETPDKHWKFNPQDLKERDRWDEYQHAYEDALGRCSMPHAPWYVVPAERRWFRNLLVARVVVDAMESLNMKYPEPPFDPSTIVIP
jgi:PPK2 family polyphosphate:nucleotide phosphotransferase